MNIKRNDCDVDSRWWIDISMFIQVTLIITIVFRGYKI